MSYGKTVLLVQCSEFVFNIEYQLESKVSCHKTITSNNFLGRHQWLPGHVRGERLARHLLNLGHRAQLKLGASRLFRTVLVTFNNKLMRLNLILQVL